MKKYLFTTLLVLSVITSTTLFARPAQASIISDIQDVVLSIVNGASSLLAAVGTTAAPSIQVISPASGDYLLQGQPITVKWTTQNVPANSRYIIRLWQGAPGEYRPNGGALTVSKKYDSYQVHAEYTTTNTQNPDKTYTFPGQMTSDGLLFYDDHFGSSLRTIEWTPPLCNGCKGPMAGIHMTTSAPQYMLQTEIGSHVVDFSNLQFPTKFTIEITLVDGCTTNCSVVQAFTLLPQLVKEIPKLQTGRLGTNDIVKLANFFSARNQLDDIHSKVLVSNSYYTTLDDFFKSTSNASKLTDLIKNYQKLVGITGEDGYVGPKTREKINAELALGHASPTYEVILPKDAQYKIGDMVNIKYRTNMEYLPNGGITLVLYYDVPTANGGRVDRVIVDNYKATPTEIITDPKSHFVYKEYTYAWKIPEDISLGQRDYSIYATNGFRDFSILPNNTKPGSEKDITLGKPGKFKLVEDTRKFTVGLDPERGQYNIGGTVSIKWTSEGIQSSTKVKATLYDYYTATDIATLGETPVSSGVLSWKIPNTIPTKYGYSSSCYYLKFTINNAPVYYPASLKGTNSCIKIAPEGTPQQPEVTPPSPSISPQVTVLTPNGGETLQAGGKIDIKWTSKNIKSTDKVVLTYIPDGVHSTTIGEAPASAGTFTWTIPKDAIGTGRTVGVVIKETPYRTWDTSDRAFTVVDSTGSSLPPVETTTPKITKVLSYTSSDPQVIILQDFLIKNNFLVMPAGVAKGYFGGATYTAVIAYQKAVGLTVTGSADLATYTKINATLASGGSVPAVTPPVVTPPVATPVLTPKVTVTAPSSGDILKVGDKVTIKWTSNNLKPTDTVVVTYIYGGVNSSIIGEAPASAGTFTWTVPAEVVGTGRNIGVTVKETPYRTWGTSGSFSIVSVVSATPDTTPTLKPKITITTPNGGGTYTVGDTLTIQWTAKDVTSAATLYLKSSSGSNTVIGQSSVTTGSYTATIPTSLTPGQYRVIVNTNETQDYSDDYFTIAAKPAQNTPPVSTVIPDSPLSPTTVNGVTFYESYGGPIPEITSLSRTSGSTGNTVTITGKNFKTNEDNSIFIDNLKGSTWQVDAKASSATSLTFTIGNWQSQQYYVYVLNSNGQSNFKGLEVR